MLEDDVNDIADKVRVWVGLFGVGYQRVEFACVVCWQKVWVRLGSTVAGRECGTRCARVPDGLDPAGVEGG